MARFTPIPILILVAFAAQSPANDSNTQEKKLYSNFLEFRVYPMRDGQRENMLNFFEKNYLESQESFGMRIWGQFRDLNVDTNFVWMRGYRSMEERKNGLDGFYASDAWLKTSPKLGAYFAARPTHIHLLEPMTPESGFDEGLKRTKTVEGTGVVVALMFKAGNGFDATANQIREKVIPIYRKNGAVTLGLYQSSDEVNNVPRFPYITDEPLVALFMSFPSRKAYEAVKSSVKNQLQPFESFVLEPGARSRLRHRG